MDNNKNELLMAIDLGTSTLKVAVFDLKGNEVAFETTEYDLFTSPNGIVENNVVIYWEELVKLINKILYNNPTINPAKIIALGTSSQGETIVPIDKEGKPLRNAIVWLDGRSIKEAEDIANRFDTKSLFKITGLPTSEPSWPAARISWIRKNEPDIFSKTYKFLLLEDYIIYMLTGNFFGEASVYSTSYYYDIVEFKFIESMLNYLDIDEEKLPEVKAPGTFVGNITKEASKKTGLETKTKVVIGAMDQICGAIGAGNVEKGQVTETTGTAFAMVITMGKPIFDNFTKLPCAPHAIPGLYTVMPYSMTGGMVLKWFKDNFCQNEVDVSQKNNLSIYGLLDRLAEEVPPGSEGLLMLPHLAGAYFPEYNPKARGVYFGIGLNHSKGHFIRAIMEALGYMMRRDLEAVYNLGTEVKRVVSTGGGAKSALWGQIKADICGIKIEVPNYTETALLGAAILAAKGINIFSSIEGVAENFVKIGRIFLPNNCRKHKEVYNKSYKKYIELYNSVSELF